MILKKDYDELEAWIYHVSGKHDFNTEVFKIGETEEGRNIVGLHVGDKNHSSDKPKIFIECGIHAREWIAPAACRQFIHEILHNVGYPAEYNQAAADDESAENERAGDPYTKEDVIGLMDFNWYIILQMNPDGYQYSHTEDRMWRKNRSSNNGHFCKGVDLNRQFPVGHLTLGRFSNLLVLF